MTTANVQKLKEELVVFLRNSDILSTTERGVTTKTDTFTATAGQTVFTLTQTVARNIRSVTVNAVSKSAYRDYTTSYGASVTTVTLGTGAGVGEPVVIVYDYSAGTVEKIWPDYPELTFLVDNTPRIGFDFTAHRTKILGIGDANWLSDALVTIKVYDKSIKTIDSYLSTIRSKIKTNEKLFYHFPLVYISNMGPPIIHAELAKKVFEKSVDLILRFSYES